MSRSLEDQENDGWLQMSGTARERTFLIVSGIELLLAAAIVLLLAFLCVYVVRWFGKHRVPQLCIVRVALAFLLAVWVFGVLLAHAAFWDILRNVIPMKDVDHNLVCWLNTCVTLGFVEPLVLMITFAIVSLKTRSAARVHAATLLKASSLVPLSVCALQTVFTVVDVRQAWDSAFVWPRPLLREDSELSHAWWHEQGCAVTIASVSVSAVFLGPFEVARRAEHGVAGTAQRTSQSRA